jgi:hypothetical protein
MSQGKDNSFAKTFAAARNHQLPHLPRRLPRNLHRVPRPGRLRQFRFNPVLRQHPSRIINLFAARVSAAPRIGVVNQQRILEVCIHALPHYL